MAQSVVCHSPAPGPTQTAREMVWTRFLQFPVTGISQLKLCVCTDTPLYRFAIPKQIKMMSTGSMYPLSNKFLQNVIQAGEAAEQCPSCKKALHKFEDFNAESLKNVGAEPSNEIRLAQMELDLTRDFEERFARCHTRFNTEITTLKSDIAPLLLRRALNVAVQAALVIAGAK